jgi:hypothetical protein
MRKGALMALAGILAAGRAAPAADEIQEIGQFLGYLDTLQKESGKGGNKAAR